MTVEMMRRDAVVTVWLAHRSDMNSNVLTELPSDVFSGLGMLESLWVWRGLCADLAS